MMPKTRNRRKFRKTPYAYSDSRLAHCRARYQIRSNVISGDSEIGCKILLRQSEFAPLEGAKPVTKYGSLQGLREVKMDDVEATENADGSQSSTSHSPTHQVSLSTGAFVNDDPTPSSVATRMEYNYHEVSIIAVSTVPATGATQYWIQSQHQDFIFCIGPGNMLFCLGLVTRGGLDSVDG